MLLLKPRRTACLVMPGMADEFFDKEQNEASEATIQSLKLRMKQKFYYLFDWGDKWWHELIFEGVKDIRTEEMTEELLFLGKIIH